MQQQQQISAAERSPLSCVSAVSVEIVIACVETIQFQYLSVCLCYKCAANISSVWKIHLSSDLVQHFEHKVKEFGAFSAFCCSKREQNYFWQPDRPMTAFFSRVMFSLQSSGYNSFGLLLCISYVVRVSCQ